MTIAIPGELPTAVAQTGTLSVSASAAGVFGGAQVIEIVIDDPDLEEATPLPDVEVDGDRVTMAQATTGKWYAYVAAQAFADSSLTTDTDGATRDGYEPIGFGFLEASPITDAVVWVYPFDGDVEITANSGNEVVTLDYDDHSDIATISVDRNDVPAGGQVHITISDFQLNLDPTDEDVWILTDDEAAGNNNTSADNADGIDTPTTIDFAGSNGKLVISGSGEGEIEYKNPDGTPSTLGVVAITETRSNTGVFESEDGDNSEIRVSEKAASGSTFTIAYADDDQQIIVDDFDSTLELIADGTWDSSESLTIRLTNENLDLNTLVDNDMVFTDDDLAVLVMGDPITLDNVRSVTTDHVGDAVDVNPRTFVVTLSATTDSTPVDVVLTSDQLARLTDSAHSHYVHYIADPAEDADALDGITTDAELLDADGEPTTSDTTIPIANQFTQVTINPDADGRFAITFDTTDAVGDTLNTANEALQAALAAICR